MSNNIVNTPDPRFRSGQRHYAANARSESARDIDQELTKGKKTVTDPSLQFNGIFIKTGISNEAWSSTRVTADLNHQAAIEELSMDDAVSLGGYSAVCRWVKATNARPAFENISGGPMRT